MRDQVARGSLMERSAFLLLIVIAVAVAARLIPLLQPAVWFDEVFSIYYVQKGLDWIWGSDWRLEPTPPIYYTLLHGWVAAFGESERLLRLVSLIFSCLATGVIFLLGRDIAGRRAGFLGALAFALMPFSIHYGVEIRAYALESFEIACTLWLLARMIAQVESGAIATRAQFLPSAIGLIAMGWLLTYTHITAVFAFAAMSFALLVALALWRPRLLGWWIALNVVYLVGTLPQVFATLAVIRGNAPTLAWLQPPSILQLFEIIPPVLVGEPGRRWIALPIFALWAIALACSAWRMRANRTALLVLCLTPAAALVGLTVFSRFQPALLSRTIMWMSVPLAVLLGCGLASLRRFQLAATAAMFAAILVSAGFHLMERTRLRSDPRGIADLVARATSEDAIVLLDGELGCEFAYYAPGVGGQVALAEFTPRAFSRTQRVELGCNTPPGVSTDALRQRLASGGRVWLVGRTPWYGNGSKIFADLNRLAQDLADEATRLNMVETRSFTATLLGKPR